MKKCLSKGSLTIEASLVFILFVIGYFIVNNVAISIMTESLTRKALFETGMEFSSYIEVVDKFEYSNELKTTTFDIKEYENIIGNGLEKEVSAKNFKNILEDLKRLIKNDISGEFKKIIYNKLLKNIFINKLKDISKNFNLSTSTIIDGITGIEFFNSKFLENSNRLELNLKYINEIGKFGLLSYKNDIQQKFLVDTWTVNYNKQKNKSIWDKTNFERGRYFAKNIRENSSVIELKTGKGFDLFDKSTNTLIKVYSINIFDEFYSEKKSKKFEVKNEFLTLIKTYKNKFEKDLLKYKEIQSVTGENIKIKNPKKKFILILPEEAKEISNVEEYINKINEIIPVEIRYMEKAFNDN
ncbi:MULTISPECIES: hypothetical protein [Helcococcus]|uniref:Pilus assembly protein n=1 Tax=Helcococcus bovis TaxID=3153252 RepID=A0ABW9F7N0_9FIRM